MTEVNTDLAGVAGGAGDGAADNVTVDGTNGDDVASSPATPPAWR